MDDAEIVERYHAGERVVPLARLARRRAEYVSRLLRTRGVDTTAVGLERSVTIRSRPNATRVHQSPPLLGSPTAPQWAYIAGIFDGEGCLSYERVSRRMRNYRIGISQKERALLYWLQERLGGGWVETNRSVGVYRLAAQRQVFQFLVGVFPYLIVKRTLAREAIQLMADRYGWKGDGYGDARCDC